MFSSTDVTGRRLTVTKFREGYKREEVDAFLARVVTTLQTWEQGGRPGGPVGLLSADDVRGSLFTATKFREGYEQDEVDLLLDEVTTALEAWESAADGT